jgi:hypothetical protein
LVADIQYAVADDLRTSPPARARPIAELPGEAVLTRAEALARQWVIALIRARPLAGIGELPLEDLASEAPALCTQMLLAMQSDAELKRLAGHSAAGAPEQHASAQRLASICGARDAVAVVEAVETLRGVLWQALLDQLREPSPRLVGDVCDRLAYVCAVLLAAALDTGATPALAPEQRGDVPRERPAVGVREVVRPGSSLAGAVIVDEHADPAAVAVVGERRSVAPAAAAQPSPEIEIRDQRREHGPAAWVSSIGAQLELFERDSTPFAVLLVELFDNERLRRREPPADFMRLVDEMERALADALGARSGSLARERPGRCWLLVPAGDRAGAERLAQRLTRAVDAHAGARDERLAVAIGTAVCPDDGREAAALAAHADLGLYAARSAARTLVERSADPANRST